MKKLIKQPECKYCYDKGYYSVASGGSITSGDFPGDLDYRMPLEIIKVDCPRCKKNDTEGIQAERQRCIEIVERQISNSQKYLQTEDTPLNRMVNHATQLSVDILEEIINQIKDDGEMP